MVLPPVSRAWSSGSPRSSTTSGDGRQSRQPVHHRQVESGRGHQRTEGGGAVRHGHRRQPDRHLPTYSSNKIVSLLDALKADILGWCGRRLRHPGGNPAAAAERHQRVWMRAGCVNLRVRFDAAQTLTDAEQLQARTNIGAVAASDVGNTDTDFVVIFDGRWPDEPRATQHRRLAARIGFRGQDQDRRHASRRCPGVGQLRLRGRQVVVPARTTSPASTHGGRAATASFRHAMPDANYCWTASPAAAPTPGQQRVGHRARQLRPQDRQYVDISCATTAASFDDSSEINLVVYR